MLTPQYGFIIGQINEMPALPKYTPAFLILHSSLLIEIVIMLLWSKDDFEMVDPLAKAGLAAGDSDSVGPTPLDLDEKGAHNQIINYVESMPSSLGGTLRLNPKTANVFRDVLASDELHRRLKSVETGQGADSDGHTSEQKQQAEAGLDTGSAKLESGQMARAAEARDASGLKVEGAVKTKNPQLILLKMIMSEDGRIIKYILLFTVFGSLMAPMNFLFLSMEELCQQRDYNFSQLAGAVLISQALIETLAFLVVPSCMRYISKSVALSFGFAILALKFIFYSGWYYSSGVSSHSTDLSGLL